MPLWAWVAVVGVAGFVVFRSFGSKSSSSTSTTSSGTDAAGNPIGPDQSSDQTNPSASGISPDELAALLGPNSALGQILQTIAAGGSTTGGQVAATGGQTTTSADSGGGGAPAPATSQPSSGASLVSSSYTAPPESFGQTYQTSTLGHGAVDVGGAEPVGITSPSMTSSGTAGLPQLHGAQLEG